MFAGVRPVRTGAVRHQVVKLLRKQRRSHLFKYLLNILWHLARKQLGGKDCLLREGFRDLVPGWDGKPLDLDRDLIRMGSRPLDLRSDQTLLDRNRHHLSPAGIRAPAIQPGADTEPLEHSDPAASPPALPEGTPLGLRPDAPLSFTRNRRRKIAVVVVPVAHATPPRLPFAGRRFPSA